MKHTTYQIRDNITQNQLAERKSNRFFVALITFLFIVLIAVSYIRTFVFFSVRVSGTSMNQTLYSNDLLAVNRQLKPSRYDVVVIEAYGVDPLTVDKDTLYIKRVVALEGEDIWTVGGEVYYSYKDESGSVVEALLDDKNEYLRDGYYLSIPRQTVPEGCYFVLGDNRRDSRDSRSFGCVPKEKVKGVVTDFIIENKDNVFLQILTSFV